MYCAHNKILIAMKSHDHAFQDEEPQAVHLYIDTNTDENPYTKKYTDIKIINSFIIQGLYKDVQNILDDTESDNYKSAEIHAKAITKGLPICNQDIHTLIIMNFAQYNNMFLIHLLHYFFEIHAKKCTDCIAVTPEQMASMIKKNRNIALPNAVTYSTDIEEKHVTSENPVIFGIKSTYEAVAIAAFLLYDKIGQKKSDFKIISQLAQECLPKKSSIHELIAIRGNKKNCCCF